MHLAMQNLVSDLAKVQRDVNQRVARPGVRYTSKFIDLVPENTVFYAALPNLTESLAQSQRILQERIKQNPALAQWQKGENGFGIDERTLTSIREFGSQLGDEIVLSANMNSKGEPDGILVMGELKDPASFRAYLDSQIARLTKGSGDMPKVQVVDDPLTVKAAKDVASAETSKAESKAQKN